MRIAPARGRVRHWLRIALGYTGLVVPGAIFSIPFLWTVSTSLKPYDEVFTHEPTFIPSRLAFENYALALEEVPLALYFLNSSLITLLTTLCVVTSSAVVAFGFARIRFPLRGVWFTLLLSTMMLPLPVTMVPVFLIFRTLGWYDTWLPLWVPACFGNAFLIFLLRQFFLTVPRDLEEAATIDGCAKFGIFARIMLPLSRPALAAAAVFASMAAWNDFMGPLIYLNQERLYTLALGLANFHGTHGTNWNLLMAATVMMIVPVLILFFCAQRQFIEGITLTGIKG